MSSSSSLYDGDKSHHNKNNNISRCTRNFVPRGVNPIISRVLLLMACFCSFFFGFLHHGDENNGADGIDTLPLNIPSPTREPTKQVSSSSIERAVKVEDKETKPDCTESDNQQKTLVARQKEDEQTIRRLRRQITKLNKDLTKAQSEKLEEKRQPKPPDTAWESLSDPPDNAATSRVANVLQWDHAAMQYARLSHDGQAKLTWLDHGGNQGEEAINSPLRATPMLATVDRRASIQARKEACAVASFVAVGHTDELDLFRVNNQTHVLPKPEVEMDPTCAVCYQWANHIVAQEQVIKLARLLERGATVFRPYDLGVEDTTVCVKGKASFEKRQRWRSARWHSFRSRRYHEEGRHEDERDSAHGFAWGLWCELPEAKEKNNDDRKQGLPTSCASLHPSLWSPELQRVYYTSSFTFQTRKKTIENKTTDGAQVRVDASWPWRALVLDEKKYDPPPNLPLPKSTSSPKGNTDLKLLWAEGPLWQLDDFGPETNRLRWNMSFAKTLKRTAPSGIGERFLLSILQQASIAPGSTRLLGVVDSHSLPTFNELVKMLHKPVSTLLPWCEVTNNKAPGEGLTLMYLKRCISRGNPNNKNAAKIRKNTTFVELLERRQVKIKLVPYPIRPSLFGSVRQMGQGAFSAWMGLRFSPEYHAIMYMDSDAIPFVNPQTHGSEKAHLANKGKTLLQSAIYKRLFQGDKPCASQRFEALEYEVVQKSIETELQCANRLLTNPQELNKTLTFCTKENGHVLARTDALGMLWIHDNFAEPQDLPPGTRNCVDDKELTFPPPLVVEVHLRSRGKKRKALRRCSCKV